MSLIGEVRTRKLGAAILMAVPWSLATGAHAALEGPRVSAACELRGRITSGGFGLPGVGVTLSSAGTPLLATSTAPDGSYSLAVPAPGVYALSASLAGFADVSRDVALPEEPCRATLDAEMALRSRAQDRAPGAAPLPSDRRAGEDQGAAVRVPRPASGARPEGMRRGAGGDPERPQQDPRGGRFRGLELMSDAAGQGAPDALDAGAQALLPQSFSPDAPAESVALAGSGRHIETFDALLFRDRLQWLEEAGGDLDLLGRRVAQAGSDGPMGGGIPGGWPGVGGVMIRGPGEGGSPMPGGWTPGGPLGRSGRIQGSVFHNAAGAPFDARPFSLNGVPTRKADYFQHRYGVTVGGPFKIPGVYDGSSRTTFNLSYAGGRTRRPYDAYSTVPTTDERMGDLSSLDRPVYDPLTGEPFPGNVIPESRISPASRALLAFVPLPNQPGTTQNYHYVTTNDSASDQVMLRFSHSLGTVRTSSPGGGAQARGRRARGFGRPSVSAGLTYRRTRADASSRFETLGGETRTSSWSVPVSASFPTGPVFHMLRLDYSRSESRGQNRFANVRDVAAEAGITGVASDPFDWGVPALSFTTLSGLRDRDPSFRLERRFTVSEMASRSWGRHNVRVGAGFGDHSIASQADTNPRGSFVFTGLYTAAPAGAEERAGPGSDLADFLLGRAQQASVQYGPGQIALRGRSWNVFLQDDWRLRSSLTLNLGLRYEYVSPFEEAAGRLANLDVAPGFQAAEPVVAGAVARWSGPLPASLVRSDRNNLAPRIGVAWRPKTGLAVRAGFGINYHLGAYGTIAQRLAGQPPFAVSNTLIGTLLDPLLIEQALDRQGAATTNSFGIDPLYELAAVSIWNLDVQEQLGDGAIASISYMGTRGFDLDLQRAPNRGPTGLRIAGVAPFLWESSGAHSIMHSGSLRLRKRMTRGYGGGLTYTYGKSIDDASSIGGGLAVVAQNDLDLAAERGLSSFDRRHSLSADVRVELPVGRGRRWWNEGTLAAVLGGWVWDAALTLQSGTPFTARVLGNYQDVARGVNGTLRADVTGERVAIDHPTVSRWFNTDAFSLPAAGAFGDAGRNTITGPGTFLVNMGLIKNVDLGRPRALSVRVQATNVLNTPPLTGIDTVVNSPTFGRVVQAGSMRSVEFQTRLRF